MSGISYNNRDWFFKLLNEHFITSNEPFVTPPGPTCKEILDEIREMGYVVDEFTEFEIIRLKEVSMPFGHNLFTCSKCGKPFIWGGCIDFVCPDCRHKKYLELCPDWRFEEDLKKEEASYYIKNYETSWGAC